MSLYPFVSESSNLASDHRRRQLLRQQDGVCLPSTNTPTLDMADVPTVPYMSRSNTTPTFVPSFPSANSHMLQFNGYMVEPLHTSSRFCHQIKGVSVLYHLPENSISLVENTSDSKADRASRIFWHQKVLADNWSGRFCDWKDFNVGSDVVLLGRNIRLCYCTDATREFYASMGVLQGPDERQPDDPELAEKQKKKNVGLTSTQTAKKRWKPESSAILGLLAVWPEKADPAVNRVSNRHFLLKYHVVEGTFQVFELMSPSPDLKDSTLFLRRQRLPKPNSSAQLSLPSLGRNGADDYYSEADLIPGNWIYLLSRPMFIYRCFNRATEEFIRRFVTPNFTQTEDLNSLPTLQPSNLTDRSGTSHDRSSTTAYYLIPVDSQSKWLRHLLVCWTDDDTFALFEETGDNGASERVFLSRNPIPKQSDSTWTPDVQGYLSHADIVVGAELIIYRWKFLVDRCLDN